MRASAFFAVPSVSAMCLLAGCVQPVALPPQPIELQAYPPPLSYRTSPYYRPALPPPGAPSFPEPGSLPASPPSDVTGLQPSQTAPLDSTGPIPLQDMPAPADGLPASAPSVTAMPAAPQPVPFTPRPSTSGPGSNVPLEGFRPMRGQTRLAP